MESRRDCGDGGRRRLAACCLLLLPALAVAGVLLGSSARSLPPQDRSVNLPEMTRPGMGATVVPRWTLGNLDPRLEGGCRGDDWPVPGGYCCAPDHTITLTRFGLPPAARVASRAGGTLDRENER